MRFNFFSFSVLVSLLIAFTSCNEQTKQKEKENKDYIQRVAIYNDNNDSIGFYTVVNNNITGPYSIITPDQKLVEKGILVNKKHYGTINFYDYRSNKKRVSKTYIHGSGKDSNKLLLNDVVYYQDNGKINIYKSYFARIQPDIDTIKDDKIKLYVSLGKFDSIELVLNRDTLTYFDSIFTYKLPDRYIDTSMISFVITSYYTNNDNNRIIKRVKIEKFIDLKNRANTVLSPRPK